MRPQSAVSTRNLQETPQKAVSRTSRNTIDRRRPSTADPRASKVYGGRMLVQQNEGQVSKLIWDSFGSYIAKSLKNGKGIWIPKFGQFTFTAVNVDLAGSTNPHQRDRQERFPVFVVGPDFTPSIPMKAGIATGMTSEIYNNDLEKGPQIRIFTKKGISGIIPKVKVNYCEIAALTGGAISKDQCRELVESNVQTFAEKARRNIAVESDIPHVGKLMIKNNVTGVIFDQNILESTKGITAKNYEVLFQGNNWMNNKIYQPNIGDFGQYAQDLNQASPFQPSQSLRVSYDAKNWLKRNLDFDYDNLSRPNDAIVNKVRKSVQDMDRKIKQIKQRPQSAGSNRARSQISAVSRVSSRQSSAISRLPELAPFQLMNFSNQIYACKQQILRNNKISLRDKLTSSKIQRILQDCGYKIQIINLKALLKELGFNWNGPSCSIPALFIKLKQYLNPEEQNQTNAPTSIGNQQQAAILGYRRKEGPSTIVEIIKDLFYSTGKSLYDIFKSSGVRSLSLQSFKDLVNPISEYTLTPEDLETTFNYITRGKPEMSFQEFEISFRYNIPVRGSLQSETFVIQKIRDWMFQKQYPTEGAFQRLIRAADRLQHKSLSRVDFHKSLIINMAGLNAPEMDYLFDLLTQGAQMLTFEHWQSRIFDDALNPLQLIRELVMAEGMDSDDVLFQMKLKAWDEPIAYPKFLLAIRRLDPSFGESQVKTLFNKLKSADETVDIPKMLSNLTGTECDTVDFKNQFFKDLYKEIYNKGKGDQLLRKLEQYDSNNDGKINADHLIQVLTEVTTRFSDVQIAKFVRQLEKDSSFKVTYVEFTDKICALGNKNHSPFKSILQRLAYFIESNKQTVASLLTRLTGGETSIQVTKFAEFLLAKVDKRKTFEELLIHSNQMDIDRDGMISDLDLKTCLTNLNSRTFFANVSTDIPDEKVLSVLQTIRDKMKYKKMSCVELFTKCDTDKSGMINLAQFMVGVNQVVPVSAALLEKIFQKMDLNKIGMVDQAKLDLLFAAKVKSQIPREADVEDNFDWQEGIIEKIKEWVQVSKMGSEEAFKSFDHDFDGLISKSDMRTSLIQFLKVKPEDINDPRISRLFKLLSFYKTDFIQQSDFERLISNSNPYMTAATNETKSNIMKSMGGSWTNISTNDWKFAAIQQIGLNISQNYDSIESSFLDASGNSSKVSFEGFSSFIARNEALRGFNLTLPLLQKLFASIDPHKKSFLILKDWLSAFQTFNQNDHIMVELKNFLQCQFTDCKSAFDFFNSHSKTNSINLQVFSQAAISMLSSRKLSKVQLNDLFNRISQNKQQFDKSDFFREFQNIEYIGKTASSHKVRSTISQRPTSASGASSNWIGSLRGTQTTKKYRPQTAAANTENSNWEQDVFKNLQRVIKSSGKSLEMVFNQIDTDSSGLISGEEFKKAMKLISTGLTDLEIKKIMNRVDADNDGNISYKEFVAKFRNDPVYEHRMLERAEKKMYELNELMIHHMTSPDDAYRMFDSSRSGRMSLLDFDKLVRALMKLGKKQAPSYTVIKDLFDAIDKCKDQVIDPREWHQSFGGLVVVQVNDSRANTQWLNSPEAQKLSMLIARNKEELRSQFKIFSSHSDHQGEARLVTFAQAKKAMEKMINQQFTSKGVSITDEQLALILKYGQVSRGGGVAIYDFHKMLDAYSKHQQDAQFLG